MGEILMTGGSGGGTGSDECTATLDHVLAGETAVTSDSNDEPGIGRMTVNSIMSFSVAPYSGRRVLVKWQNPYSVPGKPFGGVIVKCMAGRYPAWNEPDGNLVAGYAGVGSNTAPGGWSQIFMDVPNLNTTYYFTCFGYTTTSFGDIYSPVYDPASVKQAAVTTGGTQSVTITGTQTYTIPDGFYNVDVFCVGGGGNGGQVSRDTSSTNPYHGGAGGGGGYTNTVRGARVTPGQQIAAVVGSACAATSFGNICSAAGGQTGIVNGTWAVTGGNGGSGGGGDGYSGGTYSYRNGGSGGQDGGNGRPGGGTGDYATQVQSPGIGQGRTTRAFGEAGNTLYSGGGGSGSGYWQQGSASEGRYWAGYYGGSGGAGGGGNPGNNGGAGTGGGGGGQNRPWEQAYRPYCPPAGNGGSGVILLRLY